MRSPHEILDEREPIRGPLLKSLAVHVGIIAFAGLYGHIQLRARVPFGDPSSVGGSSVAITPVASVELIARSGPEQPLASDTPSRLPPPAKPEVKKAQPEPDPSAVAIKGAEKKRPPRKTATAAPKQPTQARPDQLTSNQGQAVSSPMYSPVSGAGSVGLGTGNPFGNRFGYYEQMIRQKVAQNWDLSQVDPRLSSAPLVVVTFEILRDGSIRNLRVLQRSGIAALDYACQRAIINASPFPRLPAGFERNSATIEFWFQLRR